MEMFERDVLKNIHCTHLEDRCGGAHSVDIMPSVHIFDIDI